MTRRREGEWARSFQIVGKHSLRVLWGLAPALAIVLAVGVMGMFPPWERPFLGRELRGMTPDVSLLTGGIVWGIAIALLFFLVERARGVARGLRGEAETLAPFRALRRFGVRRGHGILAVGVGVVVLWAFMPTFLSLKTVIPDIQGFGPWDARFIAIEGKLHGGRQPWEWLHPLLARPWMTVFLDRAYVAWIVFLPIGFLTFTYWLNGARRVQFMVTYLLTWTLLGIGMATLFASVGPCYVALLGGFDDPFRGLMNYLHGVHMARPLHAVTLQEELWATYESGEIALTTGISAMPSLHVAISTLYATAIWHRSRWISAVLWVFAGLVLVGSVHLGWHYAIDGYVAIALVVPLWLVCGVVSARWWDRRDAVSGGRRGEV